MRMSTRPIPPAARNVTRRLGATLVAACLSFLGAAASAAEVAVQPPGNMPPASPESSAAPRVAPGHILVELAPGATSRTFLGSARSIGLSPRGKVYGSRWITVGLPDHASPRVMAEKAARLPGVRRATVDLVISMTDDLVPRDPMYKDPIVYCDPLFEVCDDQWGLFQVGAEAAWHELGSYGSPDVVIAVLDSGVDLDHDDLFANIWTNPGEVADGLDNDGNGLVDDLHGADFAGANVGGPSDNPASQDGDPDIPEGGYWVEDRSNYFVGQRFVGDAAVGDAADNNGDGYADLGVFHGTAVAALAAAMTDNLVPGSSVAYEGMAGACGRCTIMPVRMINAEGNALLSDAASAVRYAADMGADIINASWGLNPAGLTAGSPEIAALAEAIDDALALGVVIVAAAGNSGTPGVHYPAADPRVIAVGSSGPTDEVSAFSSRGFVNEVPDNSLDDDGNGWVDDVVDVVAPGEMIWSAWVLAAYDSWLYEYFFGLTGWPPGADTYSAADGTSFSAPLVSGYLGLVLSRFPDASRAQLREVLRSNAWPDIGGAGYDAATGFGRLQMVVPTSLGTVINDLPVADILGDTDGALSFPDTGKSGTERVTLDGSGSHDTDGFVVSYRWTWSGSDGTSGAGSGTSLTLDLATGPSYEVSLVVEDDQGASSPADVVTVTVVAKSGGGGGGGKGGGGGGKPKR